MTNILIPCVVIFGFVLNMLSFVLYARDMFHGKTKPNRITSGFWALQGSIVIAAALSEGVTWSILPVFVSVLGPLGTLLLSFVLRQAYWKLGIFDYACGATSILALLLWCVTKNANIAIAFAILADFIAALPTVVKAWKYPDTETGLAWALPVFGYLTSFIAFEQYSFAEVAFPGYAAVICGVIAACVYVGKRRLGTDADQPHRLKYKPLER